MNLDRKIRIHGHLFERFIDHQKIDNRITELAREYNHDMESGVAMVPVMAGAFYFASRFLSHIDKPYKLFSVQASSYRGINQSGEVQISFLKNDHLLEGERLVILEDIIDSGQTAYELEKYFYAKGAANVEIVALFYKPGEQRFPCNLTHYGFSVGSEFLVGYGLDVDEEGRWLKDVFRMIDD